jgi:hypothetical protein
MSNTHGLKNLGGANTVGIYKGPVDGNASDHFTLYLPKHDSPFQKLSAEFLDPMDFETHIAFETYPTLEVVRYSGSGGILVKLPDDALVVVESSLENI